MLRELFDALTRGSTQNPERLQHSLDLAIVEALNEYEPAEVRETARRSRGRPQVRADEDTRQLIIEAAAQEFQANGYAATWFADVAGRAGVSTNTLYRLIPTKAELFTGVVTERISRFVFEVDTMVGRERPLAELAYNPG